MRSTRLCAQAIGGMSLTFGLVVLAVSPVGAMIDSHAPRSAVVAHTHLETATSITRGAVTSSSGNLAFTGAGKSIGWLALAGGVLVLIGIALLVLVDNPRRILKRLAVLELGRMNPGHRAERSLRRQSPDHAKTHMLDSASGPPAQGSILHQGLAPGWYRDPSDRSFARYWDGTALSRDSRLVVPISPETTSPFVLYQGLPSGWYRDELNRKLARYWDGRRLSDERRSVAE
jgi:hypothetical protein